MGIDSGNASSSPMILAAIMAEAQLGGAYL
jgi:hypothetical protein